MQWIYLALCLLLGVVKVHSQTFPYVSFMEETLANHSYVDLSLVGTSETDSVQCHTDLVTCCSGSQGVHRGDWYFPNTTRLQFSGSAGVYEMRQDRRVELRQATVASSSHAGIYRCDIPTNAVHSDNDNFVRETVYIGLYPSGQGKL